MYLALCTLIFALFSVSNVEAATGYDFGDFFATVLGIGIAVTGILACLGNYARKKARNEFI